MNPDTSASFDEVKSMLSKCSKKTYLDPGLWVYTWLLMNSNNSDARYNQYLELAAEDAATKGIDKQTIYDMGKKYLDIVHGRDEAMSDSELFEKSVYDDGALYSILTHELSPEKAEDYTTIGKIIGYINEKAEDPNEKDKVSCLQIICGAGKSQAISWKIKQVLENGKHEGLIIVTDSIERMRKYKEPDYLKPYENDIVIMESENLQQANIDQSRHPILIMTTQRYSQLGKNRIKSYLKWKDVDDIEHPRPLIIIDEKPILIKYVALTETDFHTISGVIADALGSSSNEDREWCRSQWDKLKERIINYKKTHGEAGEEEKYCLYTECSGSMTEDDKKFLDIIDQNRNSINLYESQRNMLGKTDELLLAIKQMMSEGAIYHYSNNPQYHKNEFSLCLDYRECYDNIGAKVIILDGTGADSPEYDTDYIKVTKYDDFNRRLDGLTIKFVNMSFNKTKIRSIEKTETLDKADYLISDYCSKKKDTVIFTYKEIENIFKTKYGYKKVCHFGNIKGSNDYMDETCFAQTGLFYQDSLYYLTYLLHADKSIIKELKGLSEEDCNIKIYNIIKNPNNKNDKFNIIKNKIIFADITQNIFRGAVRKDKFTGNMEYIILCTVDHHKDIIKMIRQHYSIDGAKIEIYKPDIGVVYHGKIYNDSKKIVEWLNGIEESAAEGETFTIHEMLEKLGMKQKEFEKVKDIKGKGKLYNDINIKELFDKRKVPNKRGLYFKKLSTPINI